MTLDRGLRTSWVLIILLSLSHMQCSRNTGRTQMTIDIEPSNLGIECYLNGEECNCEDAVRGCRRSVASGSVSSLRINVRDKRAQKCLTDVLNELQGIASEAGIPVDVINQAMSDTMDIDALHDQ